MFDDNVSFVAHCRKVCVRVVFEKLICEYCKIVNAFFFNCDIVFFAEMLYNRRMKTFVGHFVPPYLVLREGI
jgi:hypothetical protein